MACVCPKDALEKLHIDIDIETEKYNYLQQEEKDTTIHFARKIKVKIIEVPSLQPEPAFTQQESLSTLYKY